MKEMRLRLLRKLASQIDGVDLSEYGVGDAIDVADRKARLLLAEGWAIAERRADGPSRVLAFRRATDPHPPRDKDDLSRAS